MSGIRRYVHEIVAILGRYAEQNHSYGHTGVLISP